MYPRFCNELAGRLLAASLFLPAALAPGASPAVAGNFQVDPVHIVLEPGRASSKLTVRNVDDEPVALRVLTYRWSQSEGKDVYTPTDEVLVSPPIFTTQAGATQLVRIGLRAPQTDGEQAYRVIVEEIPKEAENETGIKVAVRLNLPFYVLPKGSARPDLAWSAAKAPDGALLVTAHNRGTLHQQVTGIGALTANNVKLKLTDSMGVVLPGSARTWKAAMPAPLAGETELHLLVRTPDGEEQAKARLGAD